ncbi:MAG: methyltransferase [Pseudomonadota bacterium]
MTPPPEAQPDISCETTIDATSSDPVLTQDAFLGGRLVVQQPAKGYRAGIDAVLLAASVPACCGDTVLEAGAGVGVPSLCVAERVAGITVTAVEVQADLCVAGAANAAHNGHSSRVEFIEADILAAASAHAAAGLARESFGHVIANPPFHIAGRARASGNPGKAKAHMHEAGDLERWVRFMVTMAEADASITVIHRADALPDLLALFERRIGNIAVLPIHSKPGGEAIRVLIQGRKGSRAPLRVRPGIIMHEPDGNFTPIAQGVLREGEALNLG